MPESMLDTVAQIQPQSPEKVDVASLQAELAKMKEQNARLQEENTRLQEENTRLKEELAIVTKERDQALEQAGIDPLTEILNRRGGEERCQTYIAQASRGEIQLAYCRIDIDHFKKINDEFGHGQGDIVLKALTDKITGTKRDTDLFFRYGGEEFDLLLTFSKEASAQTIEQTLERYLDEIRTLYRDPNNTAQLTASIGATVIRAGERFELKEIQEVADKELYNAKDRGRNQVSITQTHDHLEGMSMVSA